MALYFVYSDDGMEWFDTAAEAKAIAQSIIDELRQEAWDEWPDEVESVCWGQVLQSADSFLVPASHPEADATDYRLKDNP